VLPAHKEATCFDVATSSPALALALCCALAPAAAADPFTDAERKMVDEYTERSLGAHHAQPGPFTDSERKLVESPEVQGMVDRVSSEIRATSAVVEVQAPSGGFDWGDAGIGAAGMLALFSIAGGAALLIAGRRRRGGGSARRPDEPGEGRPGTVNLEGAAPTGAVPSRPFAFPKPLIRSPRTRSIT
jgi:hypothetical protein